MIKVRYKNIEEVVEWIEWSTNRKLTNDEITLVDIGFKFGLTEGKERQKEEEN